jgi:hypothetical protein
MKEGFLRVFDSWQMAFLINDYRGCPLMQIGLEIPLRDNVAS